MEISQNLLPLFGHTLGQTPLFTPNSHNKDTIIYSSLKDGETEALMSHSFPKITLVVSSQRLSGGKLGSVMLLSLLCAPQCNQTTSVREALLFRSVFFGM